MTDRGAGVLVQLTPGASCVLCGSCQDVPSLSGTAREVPAGGPAAAPPPAVGPHCRLTEAAVREAECPGRVWGVQQRAWARPRLPARCCVCERDTSHCPGTIPQSSSLKLQKENRFRSFSVVCLCARHIVEYLFTFQKRCEGLSPYLPRGRAGTRVHSCCSLEEGKTCPRSHSKWARARSPWTGGRGGPGSVQRPCCCGNDAVGQWLLWEGC